MNLTQLIENLFNEALAVAQLVAPLAAVIGFVGLGVMYLSSSWPILGDWKRDNPKAASQVVMGLLFIVFASTAATLVTF